MNRRLNTSPINWHDAVVRYGNRRFSGSIRKHLEIIFFGLQVPEIRAYAPAYGECGNLLRSGAHAVRLPTVPCGALVRRNQSVFGISGNSWGIRSYYVGKIRRFCGGGFSLYVGIAE